ncbi:hypothetical protein ACTQ54_01880 [Fundicoccus sp. Sow4_H7]|uniref:hypothetical protein n=1 Tax=Fundicoccus sp. Sow4_H7 TaxID=3438784 RepID=UPI003F91FEDC
MKNSMKKWMLILSTTAFIPGLTTGGIYLEVYPETVVEAQDLSPKDQAQKIVDALSESYPDDTLPTYVLHEDDKLYFTAATTGQEDQENFNILYYAEDEPIELNTTALNELTPIAAFGKTTYETEGEAVEAVEQILDLQGQEVDLGYGITGFMQGAAGSTYLNWQEGNWSLVVKASNIEEEDPVALAVEVVEYLEEIYLPAPTQVGQITLSMPDENSTYETNSVVWHEDNVVYTVTHQDAMQAIRMAGSISSPTEQ